ncbi:MAG: TonB-dependent receptor [Acidobacteria bacterium]|nr:TonB-dependent receptor [Acidobacteriota bacterium]
MTSTIVRRLCAVTLAMLLPALAYAQGGGASTTGTIQGRVTDSSDLVMPGVTVTATSPSMIGAQTQVTGTSGTFRFPAVPPGTYTVTFELAGFNTFKREGIQIALGFNATVNAQLNPATLQETVTVTGASPVIDTSATSVQQNFKTEQLNSIPNGRDMWALLAATPGVVMSRIDVGGNRAGNQTGYTAYGLTGQVRVSVEGINTTEGTGGAGFYFDYGSFEEVFLGVAGQGAEAATPGVQSQFLGKSGGNRFSGEFYQDYYNNGFQTSNLSDDQLAAGLREGSNEVDRYYDMNMNFGGPIKKDKAWFHTSWRKQFNAVENTQFNFDKTFDTWNTNPSVKTTYQLSQNHKLIGYYQWTMKTQPNRLPLGTYFYDNEGQTVRQESPSWVYKGEWNGTLSDKLYVEARFGDFGYYDPRRTNSDEQYFWRDTSTLRLTGSHAQSQTDRDRKQITGAATYFIDSAKGSHTVKFGGEIYKESQWSGRQQNVGGNIEHIYTAGRSSQVVFGIPTALSVSGRRASDDGDLLVVNKLDQQDIFLNDTWALGRLTLNMGVRWDRYKGWMPENKQLAYSIGPVSVPEQLFPERDFFTWNSFGPRVGMTYDLRGDGHTVVKASYGLFWHNPGPTVSADANPNQNNKSVTYNWNDLNGDRRYQVGEEVGAPTNTTLAGTIQFDPDTTQPFSHDAAVYLEQQLPGNIGSRLGFVYKTEDDLIALYNPSRPISAYTVPFTFRDVGVDNVSGTSDDNLLTLYGVPTAQAANFPITNVEQNTDRFSRYKTIEASMAKRQGERWSAQVGGSYTWANDFPGAYPNDPNGQFAEPTTRWDFKVSGSYLAPFGIHLSPLLRHQAGQNFARQISVGSAVATAAGAIYNGTIYAEARDARRQDNVTVLDLRADRAFTITGTLRVRLIGDLFNITNSNAVETRTVTTGSAFNRPTAVLAPRTARIAVRLTF